VPRGEPAVLGFQVDQLQRREPKRFEVSSGQYKKHHGWNSRKMIMRDGMIVLLNKDGSERERRPMEKKNDKNR